MSFSASAAGPHGEMRSGVIVTSSTEPPIIPPTTKREQGVDDCTASSAAKLSSQNRYVGAGEVEKLAPTIRPDLIDKIEQLKTELRLAMEEAADEGEGEKPVYLRISNFRGGRFGYDWYMYDLVKKQRVMAFDRMEWEGGVRNYFPAVVVSGSAIYVLGGAYPCPHPNRVCPNRVCKMGLMYCRDVLYFDTKYPQDGWKVGPQLPSTHEDPFATSMDEKLYVFGELDTVPSVLDTAVKEAGWKYLPELDLEPSIHSTAHPDPSRDRILLRTYVDGLFAYSLLERKWEHIDPDFDRDCTRASIVVGDVLYYHPYASYGNIMRAYDLVHRQQLTVVYRNLTDYGRSGYFMYWNHLLDLGSGKLCLVKFSQMSKIKEVFFLKLKVRKETGENKVHITLVSAQGFNMEGDDRYEGALTL